MTKYTRKLDLKLDCPMEVSLHVLAGKWKPAIISALFRGPQRPRDLMEGLPEASRRVLNRQLNELQEHGIISKTVYDEMPQKVEYTLTPIGLSLKPLLDALNAWGRSYDLKI